MIHYQNTSASVGVFMLQCNSFGVRISAHNMHLGNFHCTSTNTIVLFPMRAFNPTIRNVLDPPLHDNVLGTTYTRARARAAITRITRACAQLSTTHNTSAMLSIIGRAGATPLVVVEKPHALSCFMTVDKEANTACARSRNCIQKGYTPV